MRSDTKGTKDAQRCQERYAAMPEMPGDARKDNETRMKHDIIL